MSLSSFKRFEDAPFARLSLGLLGSAPGTLNVVGVGGAVPLTVPLPIAAPQPSLCVSGMVQRSFLMRAGFRISGNGHYVTGYDDNSALNSAVCTGIDSTSVAAQRATSATFENSLVPMKLDATATLVRTFGDNVVPPSNPAPANFTGLTADEFYVVADGGGIAGGNSYICLFKDIIICKSNFVTFQNLPAYGSVQVSVNGGAAVVVNVDGNGDGTFDFGATLFPCSVRYSIFDAPNAGGKKVGILYTPQAYGGDVVGYVRQVLNIVPFNPINIKRLEAWLAPEKLAGADASLVNVWPDASGTGRDFVPLAASPTLRRALYANPVVDFTGQVLYNNAPQLMTVNETIAIVLLHRTEATPHGYISQTHNAAGGWNLNNNGGAGLLSILPGYVPVTGGVENALQFVLIEWDALRTLNRVWYNGNPTPVVSRATLMPTPFDTVTTSLGAFYADQSTAYSALLGSALIGEVMIFSKRLRDADRAALFAYLKAKWGNAW